MRNLRQAGRRPGSERKLLPEGMALWCAVALLSITGACDGDTEHTPPTCAMTTTEIHLSGAVAYSEYPGSAPCASDPALPLTGM